MKKLSLLFLLIMPLSAQLSAQSIVKSLERDVPGEGKVTIHQDAAVEAIFNKQATTNASTEETSSSNEHNVIKSTGYRVQVYAGSNSRASRSEAYAMNSRVKDYFPELSVYTFFTSPRWLCRVGDFRSIEEADAMMRKLKATGVFKQVAIVKDQINIHL